MSFVMFHLVWGLQQSCMERKWCWWRALSTASATGAFKLCFTCSLLWIIYIEFIEMKKIKVKRTCNVKQQQIQLVFLANLGQISLHSIPMRPQKSPKPAFSFKLHSDWEFCKEKTMDSFVWLILWGLNHYRFAKGFLKLLLLSTDRKGFPYR